jgi:hypothetical protein
LLAGLAIAGSAGWPQTNRAAQSGTYAIAHWQSAADQAARKNPDARVLVVEISSGRLLAHAASKAESESAHRAAGRFAQKVRFWGQEFACVVAKNILC